MTQHGMGDEATIDEIINDVDTDKVIIFSSTLTTFLRYKVIVLIFILWPLM